MERIDLHALGARVVSVYGPFHSRVLVEMPADEAEALFPDGSLADARRSLVLDAVQREVDRLRKSSPDLADGALAASALAMALEIDHPYNSATSKSMCQNRMQDALEELRALKPPERERDGLDDLSARRADRLSRGAAASD